jgi:integrase
MEIYKRPDGRSPSWQIDYVHPVTGERRRESLKFAGSKVEAQKRARALMARLEAEAEDAAHGPPPIPIREAVDNYLEHLASEQKPSVRELRGLRDKLFGLNPRLLGRWSLPEDRMLHTLTPADIATLVMARRAEGNSPQTIAHEIKLVRAATRYASAGGYRVPEQMLKGTVPNAWRIPHVPLKTRYLSIEEFQRVYDHMDPDRPISYITKRARVSRSYVATGQSRQQRQDARDLLVALTMSGGRWSEVKRLRWDRVDTAALQTWGQWAARSPEDREQHPRPLVTIILWGNKGQKERLLGCSDLICAVLWRLWQVKEEGVALIFPNRDGSERGATCRAISRAMNA